MCMDGRSDRQMLIGPLQEWKYAHRGNLHDSKGIWTCDSSGGPT